MGIFNTLLGKSGKPELLDPAVNQSLQRALGNPVQALEDEANQRNSAIFNALSTKVMVADTNHVIISVNPAVRDMLREAQADIRKQLPHFDVDKLVGSKMDIFHKAPVSQKVMMESLKGAHHARITVGTRQFELNARPLLGAGQQRLGTMVEWNDVTEIVNLTRDKEALQQERDEFARVKSALDQLDVAMMIVDRNNQIEYGNSALFTMFRAAESEIRMEVPGFSAANFIGSSLDSLCRDSSMHGKGRSQLRFGNLVFQLRLSALQDAGGQRAGMVIEWKDKTGELQFEESIIRTVEDAIIGDLNGRIATGASSDNIANMGSRINQLLDTFTQVITETGEVLSDLSAGKLTRRITSDFRGVFGKLKGDVNNTIDNLVNVVNEIRDCASNVKSGAGEISSGNSNLSQRTEQQAASLEETSAAMEEITSTVQQNAANAVQANMLARGARESAENGGDVVNNAVAAMQAISESSNRINDIIGVIDEIAFQTNLLALNAAVEAARAGDQGRGFAVVADEVRNLAGRSATAAKEIKELIKDSGEKVKEGSRLVNKSGETLHEIVTAVKKVNDIVAEISTASDEQATGLDEINRAVGEMDDMTQQNAALVEEAAAASEALGEQARNLEGLIAFFDLGSAAISRAPVAATKPASTVLRKPLPAARKPAVKTASRPLARTLAKPLPKAVPKPAVSRKPVDEDDKNWAEF
jgi:methyl-accepting chemotaxis protein